MTLERFSIHTLLFDGDCGFCRFWVKRWIARGAPLKAVPFQTGLADFPQVDPQKAKEEVQLVAPDGSVTSGADAVYGTMALGGPAWPKLLYARFQPFAIASDFVYRFVSARRPFFSRLTRLFWGDNPEPSRYAMGGDLFQRALGAVYAVAFGSLWPQLDGLIGSNGILPARTFLNAAESQLGSLAGWYVPTVFWLSNSDAALRFVCAIGVVTGGAIALLGGSAPFFALAWIFYLSLVSVGGVFMGYQWDALLCEAGFIAIFFSPLWRTRSMRLENPPGGPRWLLRWLVFRLMLGSGVSKILSGDPVWASFSALTVHYQTQPLPTPVAWFLHQAPLWFHQFTQAIVYVFEIAVPAMVFGPRRVRHLGARLLILFQFLIAATGNFGFFNFLTVVLCLPLFDDAAWPRGLVERRAGGAPAWRWPLPITATIAGLLFVLSLPLVSLRTTGVPRPTWLAGAVIRLSGFEVVNDYGLFSVMTSKRDEIELQGSNDGKEWLPYDFKYKPDDPAGRPRFVAPHMPRLDWQMWFAALGDLNSARWFLSLSQRLLEGSPEVAGLFKVNPFPQAPPVYVRAVRYEYRFTTAEERRETGAWWRREGRGLFCPPVSFRRIGESDAPGGVSDGGSEVR